MISISNDVFLRQNKQKVEQTNLHTGKQEIHWKYMYVVQMFMENAYITHVQYTMTNGSVIDTPNCCLVKEVERKKQFIYLYTTQT